MTTKISLPDPEDLEIDETHLGVRYDQHFLQDLIHKAETRAKKTPTRFSFVDQILWEMLIVVDTPRLLKFYPFLVREFRANYAEPACTMPSCHKAGHVSGGHASFYIDAEL
jgi:hypothetical protein